MGNENILSDLNEMQQILFNEIEFTARKFDYNIQNMVMSLVAGICDVDVADMLSSSNKLYISQSRWMFWYALRWLTNETYIRISERTSFDGHCFCLRSVADGINKMAVLIDKDPTWRNRWNTIKKILKIVKEKGII